MQIFLVSIREEASSLVRLSGAKNSVTGKHMSVKQVKAIASKGEGSDIRVSFDIHLGEESGNVVLNVVLDETGVRLDIIDVIVAGIQFNVSR